MIKLIWSGILCLLLLTACDTGNNATRQNDFTSLTSMRIVAPTAIAAKTSAKLTVIGNFSGLFERDITDQVTWTSSDTSVAGFSFPTLPSRVRGIAAGTATLTAASGTVKASTALTITNATITPPLAVTPLNPSVPKGLSTQFTASGTFSDGSTQDLTFDATWSSADPTIATVSDALTSKGLAEAQSVGGPVTITATFDVANGTSQMTVTAAVLQSIAVTPANISLLSLSSTTFKATGTYSDKTSTDISSSVSWSSSNTASATIATNGAVSTLDQGISTIRAVKDGIIGFTNLKVTGGNLTGFSLTPASMTLAAGSVGRITATGNFSNGTSRDITGKLSWSTSAPANVTYSAPGGNLLWVNAGAATPAGTPALVTGTIGTLSASSGVTVTSATLNAGGLTITPASRDLNLNASGRYSVSGVFSDGSRQDLTYSANWASNASAIAEALNLGIDKGRVKGVASSPLTVTISASDPNAPLVAAATASVTVTARALQNISTTGFPLILTPGTEKKLTVTASYSDGSSQDVTEDATFSSSNTSVVTMADSTTQPGTILIVDSGTTLFTVSFGGLSQQFTISVPL